MENPHPTDALTVVGGADQHRRAVIEQAIGFGQRHGDTVFADISDVS